MDVDRLRYAASELAFAVQELAGLERYPGQRTRLHSAAESFGYAIGAPIHYNSAPEEKLLVAAVWAIGHLDEILAAFAAKRMENPHGE